MKKSSKILIAVSVVFLTAVVAFAAFNNNITLPGVSKRVEAIALSQNVAPQVSVYSA